MANGQMKEISKPKNGQIGDQGRVNADKVRPLNADKVRPDVRQSSETSRKVSVQDPKDTGQQVQAGKARTVPPVTTRSCGQPQVRGEQGRTA